MCIVYSEETTYVRTQQEKLLRTQIINDLLTNIFYNIIETEDRIAADERFEDLSSNDMRVLSAIGTDEPKSACQKTDGQQFRKSIDHQRLRI